MIAVIQCAARKQARAGRLQLSTGKPVVFVADPKAAPADDAVVYARPEDLVDDGTSWRDVLKKYNAEQRDNPHGRLQPGHSTAGWSSFPPPRWSNFAPPLTYWAGLWVCPCW